MVARNKIRDALHGVKVKITGRDVANGDKKNPAGCAAALAIIRQVPNAVSAKVFVQRIYVTKKNGSVKRYKTPQSLRSEIIAFDRGGAFEPGKFELEPIPAAHRTGAGRVNKPTRKATRKAKPTRRRPYNVPGVRGRASTRAL